MMTEVKRLVTLYARGKLGVWTLDVKLGEMGVQLRSTTMQTKDWPFTCTVKMENLESGTVFYIVEKLTC